MMMMMMMFYQFCLSVCLSVCLSNAGIVSDYIVTLFGSMVGAHYSTFFTPHAVTKFHRKPTQLQWGLKYMES